MERARRHFWRSTVEQSRRARVTCDVGDVVTDRHPPTNEVEAMENVQAVAIVFAGCVCGFCGFAYDEGGAIKVANAAIDAAVNEARKIRADRN